MIEGSFDRLYDNRPIVLVEICIDALNVEWTSIRALIDTGAVYSAVHGDAALLRLGIGSAELAVENWPAAEKTQLDGLGGAVPYRKVSASYRFSHDTGEQQIVDGTVHIGSFPHESESIPSLLGLDVLQEFRLTLDGPRGAITLD